MRTLILLSLAAQLTTILIYLTGPSALKVTTTRNIGDLSVVVQWDEVDDFLPTNYTITWTSDGTNPIQSHSLIEQSSYTITGLTLDAVYTITVTATNRCGTGPEYRNSVLFPTGMYVSLSLFIIMFITVTAYSCGCCIYTNINVAMLYYTVFLIQII